ncbi:CinA family protein [Halobaculum sp. MBLA0143]|uniref:CinA family protein n=1 Tax=Halobaculum sp. MBLA0143 TaxID=3079933 RepID=UPI0035252F9C
MEEFADDPPEERRVGETLRAAEETVAVAESCTGGLVGTLLTAVPGSSDYFDRGVVTYSYDSKLETLAVPRELLDDHGAVSEPVARAMARGVRDVAGTNWGVSTTGVAGPGGGSAETPVGTVYVGVARRGDWGTGDSGARVARYEFDGDRGQVRERIARRALRDLRRAVADRDES